MTKEEKLTNYQLGESKKNKTKKLSERAINERTSHSGEISSDPQIINNTFKEFYQTLYR